MPGQKIITALGQSQSIHSFSQSEKRIFYRQCFTVWTVLVVYWSVLIKCFQFSWDLPTLKSFFWEWETRNSRPVILYTELNRIKLLSLHFPIIYRHLTVEQTAGHRQPTHCMNLKSAGEWRTRGHGGQANFT